MVVCMVEGSALAKRTPRIPALGFLAIPDPTESICRDEWCGCLATTGRGFLGSQYSNLNTCRESGAPERGSQYGNALSWRS